ncbi:bifunctional (p)ppGpp synthetase II/ guanosine-3',5'-bis pyrophosphate 3'-pyrophosphohydrolase [Candidatus Methanoplasma termitum]|uniref:Bifunctional (P)ppGpp synthetase II/ guanosine-3',5'-bis pyrophosphate 3'-pyrophosphohydrolase n=1 Tax=Candidatus Methanoplasma termitum TaxID=1577791 RepID=A0A0A7LCS4_9ARCH|nr:HD domain-containing protein [Candidatus Methanoplasma termitum]AIZ56970.1 bifunctional (p)ppGpp synthetase II/ guanosine-3',5'-bis pyrophosphate 3'-pyrophosphohydrolase [Candidatus Methanoplasma termitum]MCL2333284.1 HD domain-containing protein [Candidatus Methanoplasma sp.]
MTSFNEEYEKALNIATKAHEGQKDMSGNDYIHHPIAVSGFCITEKGKIVGLLHDVVEDTSVTLDDLLAEGYDKDIIMAVDCVSKREGEKKSDYLKRVATSDIATEVKFADMRHNSMRWPEDRPKEEAYANYQKYHGRAQKLVRLAGKERAKRLMSKDTLDWVNGAYDVDELLRRMITVRA